MQWAPHTEADSQRVLQELGLKSIDDLFAHIPADVRVPGSLDLPDPLAEIELTQLVDALAAKNRSSLICFAGGGIYDHYLPPVVRSLTMRPEFVTSYTPYQPEVSQGVLQALYEYQSMVSELTGLAVANASLYDGATAAVEALNMAVAATKRNVAWVSAGLHPHTRQVLATFAAARGIEIVEHPLVDGRTEWSAEAGTEPAAVMLAQPNYLGAIEDFDAAVSLAHDRGALAAVSVDPMTLGVLRTPGSAGADIAFAEGQPLGNPMSFGGPVVGLFASTMDLVRRLPGRIVGRTNDADGRVAYAMTLRTREQDIRREKASSNICTNQTLNAIAAAVQLAWLGPKGLSDVGEHSIQKAHYLASRLVELPGVHLLHEAPFAREFAVRLPMDPSQAVLAMADRGFLAGIPLTEHYPDLGNGLLVAATERRTKAELDAYTDALKAVIADG
ncbi:MAG: aminomethyl-transferring glycine dehydrogenase subunit GcvPA [Acidimicrobiia bacterium]|nr:aminomethyl-transferring glycine dehydrogenase subunit GcvPA [Acidimicrobiia bacterium]